MLQRVISSRTRAILVCDPSNPTGAVLTDRERRSLASFAKQHNLFIIADETYRDLIYTGRRRSFADDSSLRDRVVLVDSASKRFNVCGARVGCIASKNRDVIASALKIAQARLSTPSIEQLAVVPLLDDARALTRTSITAFRARVKSAVRALASIPGVTFIEPRGAFYIMVTLPVDDTEHFCRWLLTHFRYKGTTVLLAPGPGFYLTKGMGAHEVRIACVIAPPLIRRAIDVLARALPVYRAQYPS